MINKREWSTFDITWFTTQLVLLLIINVILIISVDNLLLNIISLTASMTGAVGTYLAVKKYPMNYLFGTIHVILYGLIAFNSKVYGDFMLNILIFLPMDIMGWIIWIRIGRESEDKNQTESMINKLSLNQWIVSIVILGISNIIYSIILWELGDPAAILDSMSTTISIFGMYLMMKYYREQWWVWLIVNIVSVGIWIQVLIVAHDLTAIVFIAMWSIYTINSIIGIYRWNESQIKNIE